MRMKIAMGFVHMLIIIKILVLSCTFYISFVLFCNLFKPCNVCRILYNFKKRTVKWKVVTGAYFKWHSYFARVSDFQLHSDFLMAVYSAHKINHFKVGVTMP